MRLLHTALASVNAAQNEYFVGTISGNKFTVEQRSLLDYGQCYAARTGSASQR